MKLKLPQAVNLNSFISGLGVALILWAINKIDHIYTEIIQLEEWRTTEASYQQEQDNRVGRVETSVSNLNTRVTIIETKVGIK